MSEPDLFDRIADSVKVIEFGWDFTAVDRDEVAAAFRAEFSQRTCRHCQHGTFGRDYNEPLVGNLITGYECAKRVVVDEEGNPPDFGCSLWGPKATEREP